MTVFETRKHVAITPFRVKIFSFYEARKKKISPVFFFTFCFMLEGPK